MPISIATFYIPILLLFIAFVALCIFQYLEIKKLRISRDINKLVSSASIGGYYLWKKDGDIKRSSSALVSMLGLRSSTDNFDSIANLFKDNARDFMGKFDELVSGKTASLRFAGVAYIPEGAKEFQCIGCSIIDEKNDAIQGVIVWFFDVSEYMQQIRFLTTQNQTLTKEVKEYASIFNTMPIPIWKRDASYKIRFCNFVYSMFVKNEGHNHGGVDIPELDQSLNNLSALAKNNNRPLRMKKHLVVQGQRRFYSITEMAINNSDETIGFAYDITDQDEIEKELARHISAHGDLLESSSSAMAVYGPDTKLKFYNNAFVKLWDLKVKWLDAHPTYGEILEVLREKRKLPEQSDFKKFRKEQMMLFQDITKTHEDIMHLPNGESIRIIAIPHALGGLLFAYENVTDRIAMEASLNTLIAVQRETLDNLSEGVVLLGEDGRIRLYNPVYLKMWSEDEAYLKTSPRLADVMERGKGLYSYGDRWEVFKEELIADILGRKYSMRTEKLRNNRTLDIISRPLPNGDTLVSFVDVTDTIMAKQALLERNDALIEADKLKTEFLANISYELRTPLTSIIGFSEVLQTEMFGKLNKQQMDYVHGVQEASSDLLSLINDVLDLSSIEAGYMVLDIAEFDLYKTLSDVTKLLRERCRASKLKLNLEFSKQIGSIIADEGRIKHVLFKVLNNSIKFTKDGGSITIGAENAKTGYVKIWVEDTGVGIAPEDRKKVFERFFKTMTAQLVQKSGAGLGLSVVKNIVELHEGEVKLESKEGRGTKVTILLKKNGPSSRRKMIKSPLQLT